MSFNYVYSVGINDATYTVQTSVDGVHIHCPYYVRWKSMLCRCYSSNRLEKYPTYKDCSVCEEWLIFSNFKKWMETQDWEGKALDKDLLVYQNKVYSPETCCFISSKLNTFLVKSDKIRGELPLGVCLQINTKSKKCYKSRLRKYGTRYNLGMFETPEEAHRAWQVAKEAAFIDLAKEEKDVKISNALLIKAGKIRQDINNKLETVDF